MIFFLRSNALSNTTVSFYMQMKKLLNFKLHWRIISFQCPTEYQEEMGRSAESSSGEQNVFPTKRGLVKLHKKVIIIII